jgi:two-component sensor histidine kinase
MNLTTKGSWNWGLALGIINSVGFMVVLIFYYTNNPYDPKGDYVPASLKFMVQTQVFQLIYQFLILISISVLAFSWAFDKMVIEATKKRENEEEKNKELQKAIERIEEEKEKVANSWVEALHSIGNSLRRIRNEFLKKSGSSNENIAPQDIYKACASNVDILLQLFENRESYGKEYVNLREYLEWYLNSIKEAFQFNKFEFNLNLPTDEGLECKALLVQKLAKLIFELSLNALEHGGKWVELDMQLDEKNEFTLKLTDKGGYFDMNKESGRQGLKIIKGYVKELDPKSPPLHRDNSSTIIHINFNKFV